MVAMTKNNEPRKAPYTWKDGLADYLISGVKALQSKLAGHTNPVDLCNDLINDLAQRDPDRDTSDLAELRDVFASMRNDGQRGRQPVKVGEERTYSVQQIEDGEPFIKLPVSALGLVKTGKALVRVFEGKIEVVRAKEHGPTHTDSDEA